MAGKAESKTRMMPRRTFLKLLGMGAVLLPAGRLLASPTVIPPMHRELNALIGDLEIGLDVRRIENGQEQFRIQINADQFYPVASCFKTWVALYYFWQTPRLAWDYEDGSPVHSMIVYSNNTATGFVLQEIARRITVYGNAIQKYNDFLIYTLGLNYGMYSWNWEDSPTAGMTDERFAPSVERYVDIHGTRYSMDNLTTAAELADGYALLLQPELFSEPDAITHTLDLLAIPAPNYQSPIERAFGLPYSGKDGILPTVDSIIGRVVNDAGIIQIGEATYILSYLCGGEGEYIAIDVLREVARIIQEYESTR